MSYTYLIQRDSAIGYWKLNGSGSSGIIGGASATVSSATWTTPPLVSNSGSALLVKKNGASVSIYNQYDAFYTNFENKTFFMDFWFSFNGKFDGSGYLKNLSASSRYFTNNQLDIIDIVNGSVQIGSVYYDYNKNTFRFKINGTDNSEAYIPVRNLNNSFYITAGYTNKSLLLYVNGERGVNGNVEDTSLFPSKSSASINFLINGNDINSSSIDYVISDLAFYDYQLSIDQMRKRVVFAFYNDKPILNTEHLGTSYFDIYERDKHVAYSLYVDGDDFNDKNEDMNINVDNVYGLYPKIISSLELSGSSDSNASVTYSNNSASLSNFSSLVFKDFGKVVGETDNIYLTAQVTFGSASSDYIFNFRDLNSGNFIYTMLKNDGYYAYVYDAIGASSSLIVSASSTISSGSTYNLGFSTYSGEYYIYVNGNSASSTSSIVNVDSDTELEIGNMLLISSSNSYSLFKNIGIANFQQAGFASVSFTDNPMYMARLSSNLDVSQIAQWTKRIPVSIYADQIIGSKVTWDSMDNCLVESSNDNGQTWITLKRGGSLSNINYESLNSDIVIRVTTPFEYASENLNQSFSNISILLYKNATFLSNNGKYYIGAGKEDITKPSYNVQRYNQPLMLRKDNFGLNFESISGSVNSYGIMVPSDPTQNFATYGIDFWVRFNSVSATSYVLGSTASSGITPSLYASASKLINTTGSIYVNGSYYASNTFTLTAGEMYHIFYNFGSQFTGSAMYINGSPSSTHSDAIYSEINLWDYVISTSSPSSRYQVFISNNTSTVTDSVTSSALWQPNWSTASVSSASGYKIG